MSDVFDDDENITETASLTAQGAVFDLEISEVWEDIDREVSLRIRRISKQRLCDTTLARFLKHCLSNMRKS